MLDARDSGAAGADGAGNHGPRARLRGWKEIGRHFGVDERTVKRWELARGLPVHRLPGEARAPVFAFADELDAWVATDRAQAIRPDATASERTRRPPRALLALLLLALGVALWLGWHAAEGARLAQARTNELTRLAAGQVAAINDQLDNPPGTLALRARLAADAVAVLGRVAELDRPDAALRRDAAEAWRRLAVVQNGADRPSLRDRGAARDSLERALALLAGDRSGAAATVRAHVQLEAARQAAGAGEHSAAEALLAAARPVALALPAQALAQEWWLARAEVASWAGDHAAALAAARQVAPDGSAQPHAVLRQLRARDLEAEALYYAGETAAARLAYGDALQAAQDAVARWPADSRMRWALLRQQWNLGSTLAAAGAAADAVPLLAETLAGWEALAAADPSDAALAAWARAVRLSYGQALVAAGQRPAAIPVLSEVVAERRQWLAAMPGDAERRRMLMRGLAALGDTLAPAQRIAEACALYREARAMGATMADDGQLTGFDRQQTLRLVEAAQQRHCR